jgi:photosystem II stability/assembly factor-like uncharacterized protein
MSTLYIATRKGAWIARSSDRAAWTLEGPHFLGHEIHHVVLDPRDGKTLLAAAKTGHLGPTVFRSADGGRSWKEAERPPAFTPGEPRARVVDHNFWLTPSTSDEPGVWYAGTSPQGLFRSEDGGASWSQVAGYNDHPEQKKWAGDDKGGTPNGPTLHSICVDPRDARHLYIGMSGGGVFESTDRGATWAPLNRGVAMDFAPKLPEGEFYPYGHDPLCMVVHPARPDRLYQQNHCGIYRIDRPSDTWIRIGDHMPREIGDIGFPMVVHPRDPDRVWVFPMDGGTVWPRTSIDGKPAVYGTRDAGASWQRLDQGLPREQAWWTVKRQAMCADADATVGLYLGNTGGEIWASRDEGASFSCIFRHLPHVYALTVAAG